MIVSTPCVPNSEIIDDIFDKIKSDFPPSHNLSTFSTSYMPKEVDKLLIELQAINASGKVAYKSVFNIESFILDELAKMWNRADTKLDSDIIHKFGSFHTKPIGSFAVGSSEACILAGEAMFNRWKIWINTQVRTELISPKLVIMSCYHACWDKFAALSGVKLVKIPIDEQSLTMNIDLLSEVLDESVIGVVGILGNTYCGLYDDIEAIDKVVAAYNENSAYPINIHVDAASGGFIEPFTDETSPAWDFRLPTVASINASGHKYGLVYPGVGWVLWRDSSFLPDCMCDIVEYLGESLCSVGVNFTKPATGVFLQYYALKHYLPAGYKETHSRLYSYARELSNILEDLGATVINKDGLFRRNGQTSVPLVSWICECPELVEKRMSENGWYIPTYPLEANLREQIIQRIVIKNDMNDDLFANISQSLRWAFER